MLKCCSVFGVPLLHSVQGICILLYARWETQVNASMHTQLHARMRVRWRLKMGGVGGVGLPQTRKQFHRLPSKLVCLSMCKREWRKADSRSFVALHFKNAASLFVLRLFFVAFEFLIVSQFILLLMLRNYACHADMLVHRQVLIPLRIYYL